MCSTQIATTCCRSITKLVVSIGSGETQINYSDDTARSFCTNPSGFATRGGLMDFSLKNEPAGKDYFKEATAFLERHFGRKPTVRASQASQQLLVSLQLNALEIISGSDSEMEEEQRVICNSWLIEEVKLPPIQSAKFIEWIAPKTESLRIFNRSWHLENCMAWKLIVSHKNEEAKCYCQRIKRFMDKVNTVVDLEAVLDVSSVNFSYLSPRLVENVLTTSSSLKKLNDLLDLQDKRNRRYKFQLKYESGMKARNRKADPLMFA